MINFTSIIQVLTEIKSSLVSQNRLPHWIEIYLVINLNSATSEQFLIQAMRQNQIQLCPFGQPSLQSIQQNLQFKVGTKGFFCSEVILTLNSLLFSHVGEREGNKKITSGIQYTMVFTASHPVTSGFCRKDILLFPFYCQKVVQERCM